MRARYSIPAALAFLVAQPAVAEVVQTSDGGFITRDQAVVDASTKEAWLALIAPAKWWNSSHTWSGDSANLSITPQAGGCFCERIPEDPDPEKITLEGSVEHMRVIQSYPERALRMQGALGPLQSEPVMGVLTIVISEVDEGTRIVWEYAVGGQMRFEIPVISKAVDSVMTQQLTGLATLLGPVSGAGSPDPIAEPTEEVVEEPAEEATEGIANPDDVAEASMEDQDSASAEIFDLADVTPDATPADDLDEPVPSEDEPAEEQAEDEDGKADRGPTVEEAFGDLLGDEVEGGT